MVGCLVFYFLLSPASFSISYPSLITLFHTTTELVNKMHLTPPLSQASGYFRNLWARFKQAQRHFRGTVDLAYLISMLQTHETEPLRRVVLALKVLYACLCACGDTCLCM